MPPLYPKTDSANVPVELAPDTWLIVPPKGTELPKGSGPGVIVLASSAHQAETIVKSATTTKTVSTGKGATSPTKVLQSTSKTIVAKAANNTIWLGKRAETLKGTNRPPIAGEPFALLPDPIKRKRITDAAATGRLKPELKREALHYWHLEDLGGSGSLPLRHYLDAIRHDLTTATHTLRHDSARIERSIKNNVVRFAGYEHTLVREIEAHPERAAVTLASAFAGGPATALVTLNARAIERNVVHYSKAFAHEIEAHPEAVAAVLTVAVLAPISLPASAVIVLEVAAAAASTAAGAKAISRGEYAEAGIDFASAGLGAGAVSAGVLGDVTKAAASRESRALRDIVREVRTDPPQSPSLPATESRKVDQAVIRRRSLMRRSSAYRRAASRADDAAAALALIALDPVAALNILDRVLGQDVVIASR